MGENSPNIDDTRVSFPPKNVSLNTKEVAVWVEFISLSIEFLAIFLIILFNLHLKSTLGRICGGFVLSKARQELCRFPPKNPDSGHATHSSPMGPNPKPGKRATREHTIAEFSSGWACWGMGWAENNEKRHVSLSLCFNEIRHFRAEGPRNLLLFPPSNIPSLVGRISQGSWENILLGWKIQ